MSTQAKSITGVIEGPAISKPNKELAESILAGEMKNAWQPAAPSEPDLRLLSSKARANRRPVTANYRANYERIFGK